MCLSCPSARVRSSLRCVSGSRTHSMASTIVKTNARGQTYWLIRDAQLRICRSPKSRSKGIDASGLAGTFLFYLQVSGGKEARVGDAAGAFVVLIVDTQAHVQTTAEYVFRERVLEPADAECRQVHQ